ncbi:MAG TPA: VanW family protein [Candidatus Limnocylindrales bacterium]
MAEIDYPFAPGPPVAADPEAEIVEAGRPSVRGRFLGAFAIGILAAIALAAGALYAYDRQFEGRVLPGVHVGTVDLSGLTPDQAHAALDAAYAGLGDGTITLRTPSGSRSMTFGDLGRRVDSDALVADALTAGRSGDLLQRAVGNIRTAIDGVELEPQVTLDEAALLAEVDALALSVRRTPVNATVGSTESGFAILGGRAGHQLASGAVASIRDVLMELDAPADASLELSLITLQPIVTSAEAIEARLAAERVAADIALTAGEESWTIKAATIRGWITFNVGPAGDYQPAVDETQIARALDGIARKIQRPAKDASFLVGRSGGVVGVTAARNGRRLDAAATATRLAQAFALRAAGTSVESTQPVLTRIEPRLTTEAAKKSAPLMKRISKWTTYFPIGIKNGFGANIWIPARLIDGYVVAPGATFDFWKAVGPVTRERGFRQGGAIINGKTEPQGALAGGICSCSTTLFNAALRAGFEMKARRNHYYYIDRYPLGLDATVFISGSSVQTMSWRNDTKYPVLIRGRNTRSGSAGYVTFELYSVPNSRRVVIGNPTVRNVRYASDTIQYTSSLPPGRSERIEYPVDGKQVWRTVTVYENGKMLRRVTYYSNYARITGITLVGRAHTAS